MGLGFWTTDVVWIQAANSRKRWFFISSVWQQVEAVFFTSHSVKQVCLLPLKMENFGAASSMAHQCE